MTTLDAFVGDLRNELGPAFKITIEQEPFGVHVEARLTIFATGMVDPSVIEYAEPRIIAGEMSKRFKYAIRDEVEKAGLPGKSGIVEVPVATWADIYRAVSRLDTRGEYTNVLRELASR